jgi:ketosteroid isomerase-like protein
MHRSHLITTAIALLLALTGCQRAAETLSQADKDGVKATIEEYRQAALASDWDALGRTLVNDVYYSPPHMAPMTSRDAVVAWAKSFPKFVSFTVNVDEIEGGGDLALARGTYSYELAGAGGTSVTERGTFLETHRRQADGSWKYTMLQFHSTDPLPVATAVKTQ